MRIAKLLLACLATIGVLAGSGCTYERVVYDSWDQLRQHAHASNARVEGARVENPMDSGWAVLVTTIEAGNAAEQVRQLARQLQSEQSVSELWLRQDGQQAMLMRGRFANARDPEAQSVLRQTRMLRINNRRPFESAQLMPINAAARGAVDDMDLRQYAGQYTLQVAVFDSDGGPRFREAAEMYARQLREQDEEAYYYHGPLESMVTIGLFPEPEYSYAVTELQRRHPHNTLNGSTIILRRGDREIGTAPSTLVQIH